MQVHGHEFRNPSRMQAPSHSPEGEEESAMSTGAQASTTVSSEEKGNHFWALLPSFDPSQDDPREYTEKVRFLHGVCPERDRAMLGPRLAMQMKGTAWSQICKADPKKLSDPQEGIKTILAAVSTWEEAEELQTYERFEKALYRVVQKGDETVMSFVNRMQVAFRDLGDVSLEDMRSFVLLRQSCLNPEDKKKVITMTGGVLQASKVEQAMRQLSTKVIVGQGDQKKKIYPVNYAEEEQEVHYAAQEEELDEESAFHVLWEQGDEDACLIADFEDQLVEACQDNRELSQCFTAYTEARERLRDRMKARGFWPPRKGGKGWSKGKGKKGGKGRKMTLAEKIANSHCRACGMKGHWKLECPNRGSSQPQTGSSQGRADVNFVFEEDGNNLEIVDEVPALELMNHLTWNQARWEMKFEKVQKEQVVNEEFIGVALDRGLIVDALVKGLVGNVENGDRPNRESVFSSVEVESSLAILDTGASKTVIGKKRVAAFLSSLPQKVRDRVHWRGSNTVFRFGNNGTLKSVGVLFLPFGERWMRIEVVGGETPFLLSNAFIRSLSADILSSTCQLWFPDLRQGVQLKMNGKGLYLVDLSQILKLVNGDDMEPSFETEVVTFAVNGKDENQQNTHTLAAAHAVDDSAAEVVQTNNQIYNSISSDEVKASSKDGWLCHEVHGGAPISSRCSSTRRGREHRGDDCPATRNSDSQPVGSTDPEGWSTCGNPILRDGREGSELLQVHHEQSKVEVPFPAQLQELSLGMSERSGRERECATSSSHIDESHQGKECHEGQQRMGMDRWSPLAKPCGELGGAEHGQAAYGPTSGSETYGARSRFPDGAAASDADCGASARATAPAAKQCRDVVRVEESRWEPLCFESALTAVSRQNMTNSKKNKLDILEVYCFEDSRITQLARQRGLTAHRFTRADGDLSTEEGRQKLWRLIEEMEPHEIWVSPNCYCWGNYSRFNMQRSHSTQQQILQNRETERPNLKLCEEMYLHQVAHGRHFHTMRSVIS